MICPTPAIVTKRSMADLAQISSHPDPDHDMCISRASTSENPPTDAIHS